MTEGGPIVKDLSDQKKTGDSQSEWRLGVDNEFQTAPLYAIVDREDRGRDTKSSPCSTREVYHEVVQNCDSTRTGS